MDYSASELQVELEAELTSIDSDSDLNEREGFGKTIKLNEWKLSEQTLKSLQAAQQFAQANWDSPRGLSALYERQQRMRHFNPSSYFGGLDGLDTELTELLEDPRLSDMFKSLSKSRKVFPIQTTEDQSPDSKVTNISSPRSTEASSLIHKFHTETPEKIQMKPEIGPRLKPPLCPTLPVVRRNAQKTRNQEKRKEEQSVSRKCSLFHQRTQTFKHSLDSMREATTQRCQKSRHKKQMSLGRGGRTFEFLFEEEQSSQ